MTAPTVIPTESPIYEAEILAAQDAAEAIVTICWTVQPYGPDMDLWQIGDLIWTDVELMSLAAREGVVPASGRLQ
ncbi:hypothetical protein [Methylobacterium persicinum]|uniref:Uncharacterized protein n=1 Tax=Methylobacterium persicinum TaxID=374426 RepID=A0ABU0HKZ4_9HYPH|nr:hypothetical protein [Methylobacterium persicinum]MDQ0442513.1 hypothetical protein [Methylobacterium persicinum]GJE40497.1 hypothetical protein KHHGKMAE_4591 [Methylobacterium persicinum]